MYSLADFTDEAIEEFNKKKRLKLFKQGTQKLDLANDAFNFKIVDGGFVYQDSDIVGEHEVKNAELKTERTATEQEKKIWKSL